MFTAQHYKVISLAIKEVSQGKDTISRDGLVILLSYYFQLDNPRFNDEKFRIACGLPAYTAKN